MIKLDIRADVREAKRFLANLDEKAIDRAAARAINDALVTVRAEGARDIQRQHPALRIGDIKANLTTHKAWPKKLTGSVDTKGRPLSILLFGANETRRGVTARIGAGKRQVVSYHGRKGFKIAKYGGEVFVRRDPKGRRVKRFRGPSMPGIFRARAKEFLVIARNRWAQTFPSRMKYEIEQAKK